MMPNTDRAIPSIPYAPTWMAMYPDSILYRREKSKLTGHFGLSRIVTHFAMGRALAGLSEAHLITSVVMLTIVRAGSSGSSHRKSRSNIR